MKKVLVMFLLVLFSFSSISYAETPDPEKWHYVGRAVDGNSHYLYIPDLNVARQLYKRNPYQNNFKIWVLTILTDDSFEKAQFEYDLSEKKQTKMLKVVEYDKNGKLGKSEDFSQIAEWWIVVPDTAGEALYDNVVKWVKAK